MKKNGFTLLEIIIVLTLITVILGLSTLYFAGPLPGAQLQATGRELTALIRYARSLARMKRVPQRILIDLDKHTYTLEGKKEEVFPPHIAATIIDPISGEIEQGKYDLVFSPSGVIRGGSVILKGGKKTLRIDIDPLVGTAVLKEGG